MNNKNDFKIFAQKNPHLIEYVNRKENTWQDFYELWDLYGEESDIWDKYKKETNNINSNSSSINEVFNMLKKVKPETIQNSLSNVQKFLTYIGGFVESKSVDNGNGKISRFDRPKNKIFED